MAKKPELKQLPIERLVRGQYQPRQHFDPEQLRELADSIKTTGGLLQPIVVRLLVGDKYEIIAGERRWRAAQLAGFPEVSCLIGSYSDEQALQAAIIENISRADLNPIEEAQSFQRLIDEFHYSHEEIAATIGKSRVSITNSLRLLKLDFRVREFLINGQLSEGHGKILAGVEPNQQYALAERCVSQHWSVRKLESEIKKIQPAAKDSPYSDPNIRHLETALSEHLGNRVQIECEERGGGYMRIRFNNIDELEGHFSRIGFQQDEDN
jgi:ParB family transcriptional regulator, chromosome partitioning protein